MKLDEKFSKIYFWNMLQYVEKQDMLKDMKGGNYCIDVFKIAWRGLERISKEFKCGVQPEFKLEYFTTAHLTRPLLIGSYGEMWGNYTLFICYDSYD